MANASCLAINRHCERQLLATEALLARHRMQIPVTEHELIPRFMSGQPSRQHHGCLTAALLGSEPQLQNIF